MNTLELRSGHGGDSAERDRLVERARQLTWLGLAWHCAESAIALAAGIVASSIALVGFGADSLIELLAGGVMLWRFTAIRSGSDSAEHAGHRLIALSFYVVAAYVLATSLDDLLGSHHPAVSWVGVALGLFALATMPPLAVAKSRVAELLGPAETSLFSDPAAASVIALAAAREGMHAWRGEGCCATIGLPDGAKHAHSPGGNCDDNDRAA